MSFDQLTTKKDRTAFIREHFNGEGWKQDNEEFAFGIATTKENAKLRFAECETVEDEWV